jgi:ribosome maturation factor RimP
MTQDNAKVLARIRELAEPYLETLGLFLWGLELSSGDGRPTLRVFIEGENGVDVEDCARVSRQLGLALDVEELIHGAYQLEVSSPGLERRFFELSQLPPYLGGDLDVTLAMPLAGRKHFKGALDSLEGEILTLSCEGVPVSFPWSAVAKATAVYHFETPEESKAKAKAQGQKISKADKVSSRRKA